MTNSPDGSSPTSVKPAAASLRKHLFEYGGTLAAVAAATMVRWLLDPALGDQLPYPTFYVAVIFAAWIGGLRPALLATGLGFCIASYCFIPPRFSLSGTSGLQFLGLSMYLMVSFAIAAFGEAKCVGQRRFEELIRQYEGVRSSALDGEAILLKHSLRDVAVFGFGLIVILLFVGGLLGYRSTQKLDADRQMVAHTHEVIGALETLLSTLKDAEAGQRGHYSPKMRNIWTPTKMPWSECRSNSTGSRNSRPTTPTSRPGSTCWTKRSTCGWTT